MKRARTNKRVYEPPAVLLTDLAFNLVIFFVVIASTEPATGRKQPIPSSSKDQKAATQTTQNIEVSLEGETVSVNGARVPFGQLTDKLRPMLSGKTKTEERMVVLRTSKNTFYRDWIHVTNMIEEAGGIVALQLEDSQTVVVP